MSAAKATQSDYGVYNVLGAGGEILGRVIVREENVRDSEAFTCAECGHLHWFGKHGYGPCPIDECCCVGQPDAPPKAGDVVIVDTDAYYAAKRGDRGVIDATLYGDKLGFVLGASAYRSKETGHVSCSGGPCPPVDPAELKFAGRETQRFWSWGPNGPGAGNGVEYEVLVNAWEWGGEGH
jgi:hypothetical protein